jgi:hypothetical protein
VYSEFSRKLWAADGDSRPQGDRSQDYGSYLVGRMVTGALTFRSLHMGTRNSVGTRDVACSSSDTSPHTLAVALLKCLHACQLAEQGQGET